MLRKSEKGWVFLEERLLEDFVWDCLESTLDLMPIKRQFGIKGEYCDIIARTKTNQIVILELKNCEDRYIIHQLTRYYHSLNLEQPFKELLDYSQPIRLIAIAPDFHRHNFIDRHYNTLKFEFIRFSVIERKDNFHLQFKLEGRNEIIFSKPIPFVNEKISIEITYTHIDIDPPPRMLVNFLEKISPLAKLEILRLREKMLSTDRRVKEIKDGKGIFYGRGKTKPCCQLKFVSSTQDDRFNHLKCFLWLPIPPNLLKFNKKDGIGRMYISCNRDFQTVETVTYWTETSRYSGHLPMPIEIYLDKVSLDKRYQNIDLLFELALKLNLERN